jgi:hypothetical protein
LLDKIEGVESNEIIEFFGVKNIQYLGFREFKSSLQSDCYIIGVFKSEFQDNLEMADKVLYLSKDNNTISILYVMERKSFLEKFSQIDISMGLSQNPFWIIEYDNEMKYSNFMVLKSTSPYERCVDGCIKKSLDSIFNEGSIVRRVRFIATAPVEFAWIAGDCMVYCVPSDRR